MELLTCVTKTQSSCTIIIVSKDPVIMSACDRVILMEDGVVGKEGTMAELTKTDLLNDLIN
jgi:ABC-type glutathione transport system ATPase component